MSIMFGKRKLMSVLITMLPPKWTCLHLMVESSNIFNMKWFLPIQTCYRTIPLKGMDVLNLQYSKLILGCLCGNHYCHCANLYLLAWDSPKAKQHATHLWQLSSIQTWWQVYGRNACFIYAFKPRMFLYQKNLPWHPYVSPKGWNVVA